MSDEATKAAEKAARKEAKRAAKKAAKEAQASEGKAAATEEEAAVGEQVSKKQKRKSDKDAEASEEKPSKKRKSSSKTNEAEDESKADGEAEAKALKKQRKAERKAAKLGQLSETPAEVSSATPAAAAFPTASSAEISEFLKSNAITYHPETAFQTYAPLLTFNQLPLDAALKQGLSAFSKPTPIQSSSWPILLQGRDCIAIAETG